MALATVCLLMAAWFGYDGLVGYPAQLPAAEAYDEIRDLDDKKRAEQWKQIAADKNLPKQTPKKTAEQLRSDIVGQYFWGGINLLVGLPALFLWLRRGKWVESTDDGLTTSWGQALRFSDVTLLDKKKWQAQGDRQSDLYSGGGWTLGVYLRRFQIRTRAARPNAARPGKQLRPEQIVGGPAEAEARKLLGGGP
ncbi:MAG: hypothetical protein R3C56_32180 [Pirellulaceae bacterium]